MKKIFSLFCALSVVLSVIAAPMSKKDVLTQKNVKKELRTQHVAPKASAPKAVNFKSLDKQVVKVADVKKASTVAGPKAAAPKIAAPKAKKAAIDVTFLDDIDWEDYSAELGWWQIQAEDDDYYATLSNADGREDAAGSYTWDQMDPEYCGIWYEGCDDVLPFTAGSCTVSINGSDVTVEGTFECEDGNTYHLTFVYSAPELPAGGDYECDEIASSFYEDDNDIYYKLTVSEIGCEFRFDIVVADGLKDVEPDKTYTLDDMLTNYSYVKMGDLTVSYTSATFVKTVNADGSADINASALDANGSEWNLHYTIPAPPTAESSETITAAVTYTSEVIWFWTQYIFEAADEANAITLSMMPDDSFFGTWGAPDEIWGSVTPLNGVSSEIYSGEVTFTKTEDGFTITGKVLCENNIEYTLDLTYINPGPSRTENITLENMELGVYDGAWQVWGFSADNTQYVSIAAYAYEVSGTYTEEDLAADYCAVYTDLVLDENGDLISGNEFKMLKANLEVVFNEADSTIVITGTYLGQNGDDVPEFVLNLSGKIPGPEPAKVEYVNFEMKDMVFTQAASYWDLKGEDPNTGYFLEIRSVDPTVAGTYTEANLDDYYTYVGVGNNTYFDINTANIEVTFEDGLITIQGEIMFVEASSQDVISATINVANDPDAGNHPDYDAEDDDFDATFPTFNVITDYVAEYGELYVTATNSENATVTLLFIVDPATTALEEGVYNVLNDGTTPFIYAGQGLDDEGYLIGSYAAFKNASGYITTPIWWIVSGTAKVDAAGNIVVDALNSYERKIHAVFGSATGIENVSLDGEVRKVVVDGAVYIVRDNKMFNLQGAQVR